jgi:hypothetical protein
MIMVLVQREELVDVRKGVYWFGGNGKDYG